MFVPHHSLPGLGLLRTINSLSVCFSNSSFTSNTQSSCVILFNCLVTVGDDGHIKTCLVSPVYQPLNSASKPSLCNLFSLAPSPTLPLIVCNPPLTILK